MMRLLQGDRLLTWINQVRDDDQPPHLRQFAIGLTYDLDAVTAGLTLPWSSGQAEGQNTRVKLIKRQGYGRANFDLLRYADPAPDMSDAETARARQPALDARVCGHVERCSGLPRDRAVR